MTTLDRITQQPDMMGGKACVRGMRVTVGMIVGQIGAGHSIEEVLGWTTLLEDSGFGALRWSTVGGANARDSGTAEGTVNN